MIQTKILEKTETFQALEIPGRYTTSNQYKSANSTSDGTANDSRVGFFGSVCIALDGWDDGGSYRGGAVGAVGANTIIVTNAGVARRATKISTTCRLLGAAT